MHKFKGKVTKEKYHKGWSYLYLYPFSRNDVDPYTLCSDTVLDYWHIFYTCESVSRNILVGEKVNTSKGEYEVLDVAYNPETKETTYYVGVTLNHDKNHEEMEKVKQEVEEENRKHHELNGKRIDEIKNTGKEVCTSIWKKFVNMFR